MSGKHSLEHAIEHHTDRLTVFAHELRDKPMLLAITGFAEEAVFNYRGFIDTLDEHFKRLDKKEARPLLPRLQALGKAFAHVSQELDQAQRRRRMTLAELDTVRFTREEMNTLELRLMQMQH